MQIGSQTIVEPNPLHGQKSPGGLGTGLETNPENGQPLVYAGARTQRAGPTTGLTAPTRYTSTIKTLT